MSSWSEIPMAGGTHRFLTTRWSLVAKAGDSDEQGRRAFEELCAQYWPPIFAFARRRGHAPDDALDLAQGFFLDLLARNGVDRADQERGRFRTFLLACFTNFLSNEHDRAQAQKRGGGRTLISLDSEEAEQRYGVEAVDDVSPDMIFERRWALAVIDRVMTRLRGEFADRRREARFKALEVYLQDPDLALTYKQTADQLGMSEGAVKVTVHRMRQRFRELLVEEVSQTLDEGIDAKDEIAHLLAALGGG
jgi:RNA polymerase sigma factor (sigma-70 family)